MVTRTGRGMAAGSEDVVSPADCSSSKVVVVVIVGSCSLVVVVW